MIDPNEEIRYEDILETAGEVSENENITKDGLVLLYYLTPQRHKQLDEHLFYKTIKDPRAEFVHQDIIHITIGDVRFMFVRSDKEITLENTEENE